MLCSQSAVRVSRTVLPASGCLELSCRWAGPFTCLPACRDPPACMPALLPAHPPSCHLAACLDLLVCLPAGLLTLLLLLIFLATPFPSGGSSLCGGGTVPAVLGLHTLVSLQLHAAQPASRWITPACRLACPTCSPACRPAFHLLVAGRLRGSARASLPLWQPARAALRCL